MFNQMMPYNPYMQMQQNIGAGMGQMQQPVGAPQITAQPMQTNAGRPPQAMPQQPQQGGFFQNMTSSPQGLMAGMQLGNSAYNGVSGLFSGSGASVPALANPATNPFTGAAGLSQSMNTANFLGGSGLPASFGISVPASVSGGIDAAAGLGASTAGALAGTAGTAGALTGVDAAAASAPWWSLALLAL